MATMTMHAQGNPTSSWGVEPVGKHCFAIPGCAVGQCARKCGLLHVEITTSVTYSIACLLYDMRFDRCLATWTLRGDGSPRLIAATR